MSDKGSVKKEYLVTTSELCEILGLSPRRIQQLAKEDALIRAARGKYDLPSSIQAYLEYMFEREKSEDELDKSEEEALWTRAKRMKTELELQIMRGELHRSNDVRLVMNDMLGSFRARLLGLPSKIAPQLLDKDEIPVIKQVLKDAVFEALQELSDYDPNVFYEKSKDKMYLEEDELEELDKVKDEEFLDDGSQTEK
ncbi:hypothetical protein [Gracilibacillus xinjiangensis]|uniref:Phage DNA packaging protein, Nu1 subunit of terminase n=1 Tax=Gracilibacillus xinjiangensis TaxID=1193282 RepID=A0ABV8WXI9_9BACI